MENQQSREPRPVTMAASSSEAEDSMLAQLPVTELPRGANTVRMQIYRRATTGADPGAGANRRTPTGGDWVRVTHSC